MAFISVFDDNQLREVLARVAKLGALYVFEYSPVDRLDLNFGRVDPAEHFQRVGYRQIFHRVVGEASASAEPDALMLPRKYWLGHQVGIYIRT